MGGQKDRKAVSGSRTENKQVVSQTGEAHYVLGTQRTAKGGEPGGLGHKLRWEAPSLISAQAYKGR